ncbi:MAG: hypothetical protein HW379_606 [Actinobacteria bacterium]|jgi:hypothetical protein|nr:hypothetical protein [Actinomycetota bacterium]
MVNPTDRVERIDRAIPVERIITVDQGARNRRKLQFLKYAAVAIFFSLLTFSITLAAFSGSRSVSLSLVQPDGSATVPAAVNLITSGQTALSETELISAVKSTGISVFWIGASAGAKYAFNNLAEDQNFIRYLPGGQGVEDTTEKYRIIGTYADPNAYATMQKAAESNTGVSTVNPDGSIVFYAKTTPLHVYLAFKNLPYQIEIFDPTPGVALKLATTPGILKEIS